MQDRLAEIIILDQFSRNFYRHDAKVYSSDDMALAQEALHLEDISILTADERLFLYVPFVHSESLIIQKQSLKLFSTVENTKQAVDLAIAHHDIIEQFGRFLGRNERFNRQSTTEELEFLKTHTNF